ncbi:MAG: hypothetical protein ACTSSI_14880 [Candidatus Helarchaeota archaeon]
MNSKDLFEKDKNYLIAFIETCELNRTSKQRIIQMLKYLDTIYRKCFQELSSSSFNSNANSALILLEPINKCQNDLINYIKVTNLSTDLKEEMIKKVVKLSTKYQRQFNQLLSARKEGRSGNEHSMTNS